MNLKNYMKYVFIFGFFVNVTYAFTMDDVVNWVFNTDNLYNYIIPFFFVWFVLYSIMDEIEFFKKNSINVMISLMFSIISIGTNITGPFIKYVTSYGTIVVMVFFFAAFFGLGLSFWYRKKAKEYRFFMGSKFLTILIIHSPLIIFFMIIGGYLGGTLNFFPFNSTIVSILVALTLVVITLLVAFLKHEFNGRTAIIVLITLLLISIALWYVGSTNIPGFNSGVFNGTLLGFSLALSYALLEAGRSHNISNIMSAWTNRVKDLEEEIASLDKAIFTLSSARPQEENGQTFYYPRIKDIDNKIHLAEKYSREELNKHLERLKGLRQERENQLYVESERAATSMTERENE